MKLILHRDYSNSQPINRKTRKVWWSNRFNLIGKRILLVGCSLSSPQKHLLCIRPFQIPNKTVNVIIWIECISILRKLVHWMLQHFYKWIFIDNNNIRRGKDRKRKNSRQSDYFGRCQCLEGFKPLKPDPMTGVVYGCISSKSVENMIKPSNSHMIR